MRPQFETGQDELRIDAAGEAVLCVRGNGGGAAGLGRADRVEPGAFEEDVGGGVVDLGRVTAHDAAQADHT